MTQIEWTEPPTDGRRSSDWGSVADELRAHPFKWARIKADTRDGSTGTRIRRGYLSAFTPAGHFEARSRSLGNGRFDIYARFVGESGEDQ